MCEFASRPQFDDRDAEILAERVAEWDARPGIRVGDFAIMKDGRLVRFAYDWGRESGIQIANVDCGSFYIDGSGYVQFSGTLAPQVPHDAFEDTGETRDGAFWFFHHGYVGAYRGVYGKAPCRVFREI